MGYSILRLDWGSYFSHRLLVKSLVLFWNTGDCIACKLPYNLLKFLPQSFGVCRLPQKYEAAVQMHKKKSEDLSAIDRIDRHTFLCYELVSLGIVKQKTIEMINEKFDRIDETADGYISIRGGT